MKFTEKQIAATIKRASKLSLELNKHLKHKLKVLKDFHSKLKENKWPLTLAQVGYLESLMNTFTDEALAKAENWHNEWNTNAELRERADIISKYYIAQRGWFMEIARDIQVKLADKKLPAPDWAMTERMLYNDYADKVWQSHKAPHRWKAGDLVCCRATAKVNGWTYQVSLEGISINKDPCMVLESGSKPISNAAKTDEKRGGCRWVSINPIGTSHIFHVMEKDLKIYRQPKKKGKKK